MAGIKGMSSEAERLGWEGVIKNATGKSHAGFSQNCSIFGLSEEVGKAPAEEI